MERTEVDIEKAFIEACNKNNIRLNHEKTSKAPAKVIDILGNEKPLACRDTGIRATAVGYSVRPEIDLRNIIEALKMSPESIRVHAGYHAKKKKNGIKEQKGETTY